MSNKFTSYDGHGPLFCAWVKQEQIVYLHLCN
jgi:hypothetical protein